MNSLLGQTLIGKQIRVLASYTDSYGTLETVASKASLVTGSKTYVGTANADRIEGSTDADNLIGGAGNDIYVVNNVGDVVVENVNEGTDLVQSSISYTLGDNVENLTLTGTTAINATGNALNNTLTGNTAANILDGGAGADIMAGGAGNDTYFVYNVGDVVTENANEGTDLVRSSMTYSLGNNLENLTLTGTVAINAYGNALNNILTGNTAANLLNGNAGADNMVGGLGDDSYVVDNVGDVVVENVGEGRDKVETGMSYTLGANVENLTLTGTAAVNGTGNELDNFIYGNSAANILDGKGGCDFLRGGAGNDTYLFGRGSGQDFIYDCDTTAGNVDTIQFASGIQASEIAVTRQNSMLVIKIAGTTDQLMLQDWFYNDASKVEQVRFADGTAWTATVLNQKSAMGTPGNDYLIGTSGADILKGGLGDDTYVVDNVGDVVVENAGEGWDKVETGMSYTLGANVENLTLTGTAAVNGTGNELDNFIYGNSAANIINGEGGCDFLRGGAGNDTYLFGRGSGQDYISEYDATAASNADTIKFAPDIASNQLWFSRIGSNLEISVIGTSDKIIVQDWYWSQACHIGNFMAGDGKRLTDTKVQSLVQAMAAFNPPATGQTTLSAPMQTTLNPVLASNWQ